MKSIRESEVFDDRLAGNSGNLDLVLIVFGAKKIPELARSLGRASYEFKKAKEDLVKETRELQDAAADNAEAASNAEAAGKAGEKEEK